ncbi:MAG: hypothetical protein KA956_08955 [Pyrinomonadaceae bacterium]|nr:hypothetical protein [Pyrinomonadaceae bacterium]
MLRSSVMKILLLLSITLAAAGTSCITVQYPGGNSSPQPKPTRTPQPSTPSVVNGKTISAEMTDETILAAFEVNVGSTTSTVSKGPDGATTTYKAGEQKVSITRSVVSGVSIYATGPITGDWYLGGGN